MLRRWLPLLLPAVLGAVVINLWFLVHFALLPDRRFLLPRPDEIVAAFVNQRPVLWHAALNTGLGALGGFLLAIVFSFLLSLVLSSSLSLRLSLQPYLMILQMTPVVIIAPILVLWVGPGLKSVSLITFLICFFPLAVNTTQGLIATERHHRELFQLYRATRLQELWLLRIPAALPYFFTGLRISATLAPIGALVGDYMAGSSAGDGGGLGFLTLIYSSQARYPALFATAALTCLLGFAFTGVVAGLAWLALRNWHDSVAQPDR